MNPNHTDQAAQKYGNVSEHAENLANTLKRHRDDLLGSWEGKDANAVAQHLDRLVKGAQTMGDKAKEAQSAMKDVTSIMESAKIKIKQIADSANDKHSKNQALIKDLQAKKGGDNLEDASSEIAKLRADTKNMSGEAKKQIEAKLTQVQNQIDDALQPLGIQIAPGGGFVDIQPATTPSGTSAQGTQQGVIDPNSGSPSPSVGSPSSGGADTGGTGAVSTGSSSGSSSGTGASATPSGPPPKPIPAGEKNPAKIAEHLLGQHTINLMDSQPVPLDHVDPSESCANFVTGCLQKAGLINWHCDSVSSGALQEHLKQDGWQVIPASEAKAGDVAIVNGGHHVELCAGGGKLVGSNNNLPDGTQSISYDNSSLKSAVMVLRAPSH